MEHSAQKARVISSDNAHKQNLKAATICFLTYQRSISAGRTGGSAFSEPQWNTWNITSLQQRVYGHTRSPTKMLRAIIRICGQEPFCIPYTSRLVHQREADNLVIWRIISESWGKAGIYEALMTIEYKSLTPCAQNLIGNDDSNDSFQASRHTLLPALFPYFIISIPLKLYISGSSKIVIYRLHTIILYNKH